MKKWLLSVLPVIVFVFTAGALPAYATDIPETITENKLGTYDGYDYELWKDNGTTSMTLNGGGAFSCSWSDINNALFRTGKKFDSTKTHSELGNITMSYECDYNPKGNSYLSVYGWTVEPLAEFYVIESWGNWRPPGAKSKGKITVNGDVYDVYETTRTEQPSIQGTATFQQYWSVRTLKRTSGEIPISEHFKAWEDMGMVLGKMYEVALVVEGYQSSGTANVLQNTITIKEPKNNIFIWLIGALVAIGAFLVFRISAKNKNLQRA